MTIFSVGATQTRHVDNTLQQLTPRTPAINSSSSASAAPMLQSALQTDLREPNVDMTSRRMLQPQTSQHDPVTWLRPAQKDRLQRVYQHPLSVFETHEAACARAADIFANSINAALTHKRAPVAILATGSSPVPMYQNEQFLNGVPWPLVTTFNLDEYVGLSADHSQSYRYFMEKNLFATLRAQNRAPVVNFLNGCAPDTRAECQRYEKALANAGRVAVTVLGIGVDGHIAFNERGTPFSATTHEVDLADSTIAANARFFTNAAEVPGQALTMGIRTILERSDEIILIASGASKKDAIRRAFTGPISTDSPASALRLHPRVHVLVTKDAAI